MDLQQRHLNDAKGRQQMPPLLSLHTEHLVQLGDDDDKGRGIGKTNDHRAGQQVDQQAQPQHTQGDPY